MYTPLHYLQKLAVLKGETGLVVALCLPKYVVSGTLQEGVYNLDLFGARYSLLNSASSLRFFLCNSGGEACSGCVQDHWRSQGTSDH